MICGGIILFELADNSRVSYMEKNTHQMTPVGNDGKSHGHCDWLMVTYDRSSTSMDTQWYCFYYVCWDSLVSDRIKSHTDNMRYHCYHTLCYTWYADRIS
jgi:hypothetical protein